MVSVSNENGKISITLQGRVDSSNAPTIEKQIWERVDFSNCDSITVDAENLQMISSAGLRIVLKMRKLCKKLAVINLKPEVYEVFELTGFTEMMKVEKAFRKLSVEGCEIIGQGSNGTVYRYDSEIVVKVYEHADSLAEIEKERKLARKALVLGIPTAIPFDVVKVGEHYGSVFELLDAQPFSKLITNEPDRVDEYLSLFIDLLKHIHSTEVERDALQDIKQTALGWAKYLTDYLPKSLSEKLIKLISDVPETNTMIHGDYHTGNVEMQNGEVLLIDMDTLSFGHPVFEFASMYLGFQAFGELDPEATMRFIKLPYETATYIWRRSLEMYFDTTDEKRLEEIANKAKIISYTRLMRRTIKRGGLDDAYHQAVIENCQQKLTELLGKVDSLTFSAN